ncbi:MAG TPA: alpha/beta fold hydrolase [Pirellulales bacterium]|jgi:pimeloyl-ACP methyl ester carboxylesterase|nr:alpha/beta fold hydrolase [Pirellulales bacterium]
MPAMIAMIVALLLASGCAQSSFVTVRGAPHNPLAESLSLFSRAGPQPSDRTMQFLRSYGLVDELNGDPHKLIEKVQTIVDREPSPDSIYAIAELAYVGGAKLQKNKDPSKALDLYAAAVAHAYKFLFDPQFAHERNPYDPEFRRACEVYNGALEAALRIARDRGGLQPGASHTTNLAGQVWELQTVVRNSHWPDEDFGSVKFVSDYEIKGLVNHYHTYGLGVPLIVVRKGVAHNDPADPYYAPGLAYPMTAFLRIEPDVVSGEGGSAKHHRAVLELYDPLTSTEVACGDRRVPLETDLSTPLAYCLDDKSFQQLDQSTLGLLRPDSKDAKTGLYMIEPYQSNKIPVLMIHGLWSSPITWMEMFNDLRGQPELRANYQFWFYCYPTGQPFWQTAAELRQTLAQMRATLDPRRQAPALDQMVLVGHSMGGLVAWMQTLDSGDDFWRLNSDKPFQMVKAESPVRDSLANTYFFNPNPSIRRVITIGTPHRGSSYSNDATQWLGRKLISLPKALVQNEQRLRLDNPDYFGKLALIDVTTSIDSLSPRSPILPLMLTAPRAPWVTYHNIVGRLPHHDLLGRVSGDGDGVVPYESAHLDDVASEIEVAADHSELHRHPLSVLEVRRILLEQLTELRQNPYGPPRVMIAARQPPAGVSQTKFMAGAATRP